MDCIPWKVFCHRVERQPPWGTRKKEASKKNKQKEGNGTIKSGDVALRVHVFLNTNDMKQSEQDLINQAWEHPEMLEKGDVQDLIHNIVNNLDRGELRIAEKGADGWRVNEWLKKAVLMYFPICGMKTTEIGPYEYHDKIPLKHNYVEANVRVVPPAVARHGSYLAPGVVLMPSYVNIGAHVGSGTMVDTWATVGSCAQIGKGVHLSGGVGIGGVLEPVQAAPVIIEDHCFIGSRCIVVEGALIEEEAVLGANTVITASTHIIDVTGKEPVTYKGRVPARSVVIPGTYTRHFPAGDFQVGCALIVGRRNASTDKKTSLNAALRDFGVSV